MNCLRSYILVCLIFTFLCPWIYGGQWREPEGIKDVKRVRDIAGYIIEHQPRPNIKEGTSLLRLTRWGPILPFEINKELAEHWGYAIETNRLYPKKIEELKDENSYLRQVLKLSASEPQKYPLQITLAPAFQVRSMDLPTETYLQNEKGDLVEGKKIWSPLCPIETERKIVELQMDMANKISKFAQPSYILNGGEYGLSVYGHHGKYFEQDPEVVKDKGKSGLDWYMYLSKQKALLTLPFYQAIKKSFPHRKMYVYYYIDGSKHRGRYEGWWKWEYDYKYMREVNDYANNSLYFGGYNTGNTGKYDWLTQALNARGEELNYGDHFTYNWVCAGWPGKGRWVKYPFSPRDRYIGFLKCLYTSGMIGGISGYFGYDPSEYYLWQFLTHARVWSMFTHLDDFVKESNLLPGPNKQVWNKKNPAYEFPSGDDTVRVLARKHQTRKEWLITAWAADGPAREVKVTIHELGEIELLARPAGTVYKVYLTESGNKIELLDLIAERPSAMFGVERHAKGLIIPTDYVIAMRPASKCYGGDDWGEYHYSLGLYNVGKVSDKILNIKLQGPDEENFQVLNLPSFPLNLSPGEGLHLQIKHISKERMKEIQGGEGKPIAEHLCDAVLTVSTENREFGIRLFGLKPLEK
jgi:hypothetical protein